MIVIARVGEDGGQSGWYWYLVLWYWYYCPGTSPGIWDDDGSDYLVPGANYET